MEAGPVLIRMFLLLMAVLASGCVLRAEDRPVERVERFEFVIQPGDMDDNEARKQIEDIAMTEQVRTAKHRGWVIGSAGRVDFFSYIEIDDGPGPNGPLNCFMRTEPDGSAGAECSGPGGQDPAINIIELRGGDSGGGWETADLAISGEVATVIGTSEDGMQYSIEPLNGLGWVEWQARRGDLTLIALDEEGHELKTLAVSAN